MADTSGMNKTVDPSTGLNEVQAPQDFPMTYDLLNMMLVNESGKSGEGFEYYCHRFTLGKINSLGPDDLRCFQLFSVTSNICIMGIQVPSQIGNVSFHCT